MFELYNGVKKAVDFRPELGMHETLAYLEQQYPRLTERNEQYLALNQDSTLTL